MPNIEKSFQEPLDESTIVTGDHVSRPEIVLDKIGEDINKIDIDKIQANIDEDGKVLRHAANRVSVLADKTMPVVDRALPLEDNLSVLTADMRKTLNRLNKFADNPKLSADIRETVEKARQTAQLAETAIRELNNMTADKALRHDIGEAMSHLNQSTAQLEQSMEALQQVTEDKGFRSDVKEILFEARKTLDKLERVLNDPQSGNDVRATLKRTRSTLTDIDITARQLQQILDKKHPLIHMFLGRPGHLDAKDVNQIEK
jgi:DNA repair exonuclease SbcCD ATPase subunit